MITTAPAWLALGMAAVVGAEVFGGSAAECNRPAAVNLDIAQPEVDAPDQQFVVLPDDEAADAAPAVDGVSVVSVMATDVVTPEDAVAMGLAGIAHLYPAHDEAERELLAHAVVGAWSPMVNAFCGWSARRAPGDVDAPLAAYLLRLRTAGLFIQGERHEQSELLQAVGDLVAPADLAPLYRAAVFADADAVIIEGLWGLIRLDRPTDTRVIARVAELAAGAPGDVTSLAGEVLAWIRGDGPLPQRTFSAVGGSGQFIYHRVRGCGCGGASYRREGRLDASQFTLADLSRLERMYASGDDETRNDVAWVLYAHCWPEAFGLATRMLDDSSMMVRTAAVEVMGRYDTPAAMGLLVDHYAEGFAYQLRVRACELVFASDASFEAHDRLFPLALSVEYGGTATREAALVALETGRLSSLAAACDTLIERYCCQSGPTAEVVRALAWIWRERPASGIGHAVGRGLHEADEGWARQLTKILAENFADRCDAEVVPLIRIALDRQEVSVRTATAASLVTRFGPEACDVLQTAVLADPEPEVACAAMRELCKQHRMEHPLAVQLTVYAAGLRVAHSTRRFSMRCRARATRATFPRWCSSIRLARPACASRHRGLPCSSAIGAMCRSTWRCWPIRRHRWSCRASSLRTGCWACRPPTCESWRAPWRSRT
ncbi:MAG: HEAT repeat domain-containing protein [Planctomycetota bacterium]